MRLRCVHDDGFIRDGNTRRMFSKIERERERGVRITLSQSEKKVSTCLLRSTKSS